MTAADPRIGTVLGDRFRLCGVLGEGGMGTVYAADRTDGSGQVAIKALLPELNESPEMRSRFEREAHATGFLQHPHLVEVYEMGTMPDGGLYLAMELIRGSSLADLIEVGPLHPRRALVIARQALLGLDHAHQHGFVHRDLKPENVMVGRAGTGEGYDDVKLLDFGVVKLLADAAGVMGWEKLTKTGVTFGTPRYMAPEQALGRDVDGRADLYSLGVILFETLTGFVPFDSDDSVALLRMHITAPPPALGASMSNPAWCTGALESLVARALAKSPAERFDNARAMLAALDQAFVTLDHLPAE